MAVGLEASHANALMDALLRNQAYTPPAAVYIQLHKGDPGPNGTANAATETTRKLATYQAASGGATTNTGALLWSNVAATETYSHYTAWDASTNGNFIFSDALTAPVAVTAGNNFQINAGDLDATLTTIAA